MGDANPIGTIRDYSLPSYEGYHNTIELPEGAKVSPCDPTPSDSIDLSGATRNTIHLRLFCFSLRDQAMNWLDRLPAGSISTWDDLTTLPRHGLNLWLQVQIFYDHVDYTIQLDIDYASGGRLRKLRPEEAWETIEDLAQHEEEEWNDPIFSEKESFDYRCHFRTGVRKYGVSSIIFNEE
ncbi:hypothetical protein Tco_0714569 [Tanacetum coccineum]